MAELKNLSADAVLIDGELFVRSPDRCPSRCPKCEGPTLREQQEGFLARSGCVTCNLWLAPVVCVG